MKTVAMQIAVILLNILYVFFLPLKMRDKVSVISRQADKPSVDIIALQEQLVARDIETVVLTKRLHKNLYSGIKYGLHMVRQMYHIATSKVVVLDGYCILVSVLHKKRGQSVIQMWHALGAIKKFGHQTVGKKGGNKKSTAKIMRLHHNYDYVLAPSVATGRAYQEAFGVSEAQIKYMGLPRIDYLMGKAQAKVAAIYEEYPQLQDKQGVLYVPTFRKNTSVDINEIIEAFDFNKYNLIIKKHWLDKRDYDIFENGRVIIDKKYSSMEWLKICDKIVTDYSAIAFEATLLEKQIYFYIPDVDEYKKDIGLNIDLLQEQIGIYASTDAKELCEVLAKPYEIERVLAFRNKYIEVSLRECTEELTDFVCELLMREGEKRRG